MFLFSKMNLLFVEKKRYLQQCVKIIIWPKIFIHLNSKICVYYYCSCYFHLHSTGWDAVKIATQNNRRQHCIQTISNTVFKPSATLYSNQQQHCIQTSSNTVFKPSATLYSNHQQQCIQTISNTVFKPSATKSSISFENTSKN